MITARLALAAKLAIIVLVAALTLPKSAWAASGNVQSCLPSTSCTIGEFYYDDSYVPITTATCKITTTHPDGTTIISNAVTMSSAADGWYSKEYTDLADEGIYRSQVCCKTVIATFATTDVNTTNEQIVIGRSMSTATAIKFLSTTTLPAGLTAGTVYYAINVNATTIKVATTVANAQAGTAIDLTDQGTGTHTIETDDNMCLDKTFEVKTELNSTTVASSVWNATRASYTASGSFGQALQNVVPSTSDTSAAVWGYSGRTLSGFGTLVADIWSSVTRTLTGASLDSGSLAVQTDVTSARDSIKGASNKDLSQVTTDVAAVKSDTASIKTTVEATQTTVNNIYIDTQAISTDVTSILAKWGSLTASDINTNIDSVQTKLGATSDTSANSTLFGKIAFIKDKWGSQSAQDIYDQAAAASSTISLVRTDLNYGGKSTTAYEDMQRVIGYIDTLETLVGTSTDSSSASTLFGKLKSVQDKVDLLTGIQTDIDSILDKWGSLGVSDITSKIKEIKDQLTTVSTTTTFSTLINQTITNNTTITELKNELLTMKAVAQTSQELLEKSVNKPIISTFLLEGSVIFRSLIVNPSDTISQTVAFQYYLPQEVKKEDILELDQELTVVYDGEKKKFYVKGDITLAPSETKTISVRVEDIWKISDEKIASLRKQADELYKPLVNSSYFGQAVTIKSDIDVALDKVLEMQKTATTPEKKILAYDNSEIELKAVQTKIDKMKDLVAQAGSSGSLMGFVGGAQAMAVWGIIIILIAGFVFLAIYMKMLSMREAVLAKSGKVKIKEKKHKKDKENHQEKPLLHVDSHGIRFQKTIRFAVSILYFSAISIFSSGITMYVLLTYTNPPAKQLAAQAKTEKVLGEKKTAEVKPEVVVEPQVEKKMSASNAARVKIVVSNGEPAFLRNYPISSAEIVTIIRESQEVQKLDETTNWIKVKLIDSEGWIEKEFIISEKKEVVIGDSKKSVVINATPTGFLRVRKTPGGLEIGQVDPGDAFTFINEANGWVQIERENGTRGWVSKQYATIASYVR